MPLKSVLLSLASAMLVSTAAFAADELVKPAPTPAPKAGPTIAAAQAFCGDPVAKAEVLFARYSTAKTLKETYKSNQYIAFADDEKNPTLVYTFTVKGQPAHPAAVCRKLVKEGESAVLKMDIVCDGDEAMCTTLKNDFNVMTAKMQAEVDQQMAAGKK